MCAVDGAGVITAPALLVDGPEPLLLLSRLVRLGLAVETRIRLLLAPMLEGVGRRSADPPLRPARAARAGLAPRLAEELCSGHPAERSCAVLGSRLPGHHDYGHSQHAKSALSSGQRSDRHVGYRVPGRCLPRRHQRGVQLVEWQFKAQPYQAKAYGLFHFYSLQMRKLLIFHEVTLQIPDCPALGHQIQLRGLDV